MGKCRINITLSITASFSYKNPYILYLCLLIKKLNIHSKLNFHLLATENCRTILVKTCKGRQYNFLTKDQLHKTLYQIFALTSNIVANDIKLS